MDRVDLEGRLMTFGASVADRLTDDQRSWFAEFIAAGEYGIALEMLADWLSEADAPVFPAERTEAAALSKSMGNEERVVGPLNLCPDHPG
ncbi:MAG: MafI family immunity protein [Actinobacteria bacterium]|nr:MafI family immunity protein [Actinomycetota bacterium]